METDTAMATMIEPTEGKSGGWWNPGVACGGANGPRRWSRSHLSWARGDWKPLEWYCVHLVGLRKYTPPPGGAVGHGADSTALAGRSQRRSRSTARARRRRTTVAM